MLARHIHDINPDQRCTFRAPSDPDQFKFDSVAERKAQVAFGIIADPARTARGGQAGNQDDDSTKSSTDRRRSCAP